MASFAERRIFVTIPAIALHLANWFYRIAPAALLSGDGIHIRTIRRLPEIQPHKPNVPADPLRWETPASLQLRAAANPGTACGVRLLVPASVFLLEYPSSSFFYRATLEARR